MNREKENRGDVLMRLRRIEGQTRGLQRMVEEGRPIPEILTQVAAVTAAAKGVGMFIAQCYLEEYLEGVVHAGEGRKDRISDFQKAIARYIDLA